MKYKFLVFYLLLSTLIIAQEPVDSIKISNNNKDTTTAIVYRDTAIDLRPLNAYGDLLDDDPHYNRRYPVIIPALRVVAADAFSWATARYVFDFDWARVSPSVWKQNLKAKWEWDNDRFGINFIGHPHSGSNYFNVARSNGYSFWASWPFAIGGSFLWEYFGENTAPSKNDLINTPVSGAFLGEILYRISSNILDDRKRGRPRVFREIVAGIIDPTRALNRLTQGKMFRVTKIEVYQKEPLNITLSGGYHKVNDNNKFGSGGSNVIFNLQFDYGDPFEIRRRKPFDLFRFRLESRYGDDKKIIDNVLGYGLLYGKNISGGNHQGVLAGVFQHFDYWNNKIFELGSLGFGPGIIVQLKTKKMVQLYSSLHFAGVPIAGNSTRFGPDSSEFRDYPFGGGFEGRIEERLNIGKLSLGFNGYYYWIFNYEGVPGKSRIGILKPIVSVQLYKNISLGFEHHVYYDNRFIKGLPALHMTRTEQKFFVQIFLEDRQRMGRYH